MRALFINTGGIGDQILLLPTVKILKTRFPACDIDLLTEPRSVCIKELTNLYRNVKEFDFKQKNLNVLELRGLLRKHYYKYIFCTGSSYKANFVASLGKAEYKIGFKKGIFSDLFLTHPVKLNSNQYTANMFTELLLPAIPNHNKEKNELIPEIKISPNDVAWAKDIIAPRIREKYYARKIFLHPGTSKLSIQKNILKGWGGEHWAKVIEKLLDDDKNIVIIIGGKDDEEVIKEIHKNLPYFAKPQNLFDLSRLNMNIAQLAATISFSDLLLCCDSAPMHIAVALGKKLIAFFGPTDPIKLLPSDPKFTAVYVNDLDCRPCLFDHRKESCSKPVCLDLKPEAMLETISKVLA